MGPPWAQFGYEFEGLEWAVFGALFGGAAGLGLTTAAALGVRQDRRGRARVGAVIGALTLGTAGGVGTFPPTAPQWVLPVVIAAVIGVVVGAAVGARLAVLGLRTT